MNASSYLQFVRARWVLTEGRIIEDGGVVVISAAGHPARILAIFDPHFSTVPTTDELISIAKDLTNSHGQVVTDFVRLPDRFLGNVAVLPAMVNAHTHLEFSDCAEPIGPAGCRFSTWIQSVIAHRARSNASMGVTMETLKAATCWRGWQEMVEGGTAAAGEILSRPAPSSDGRLDNDRAATKFLGTIFHEVLGLAPDRARASWEWAMACLAQPRTDGVRLGLSPHAPYSTSTWLYRQCAEYSRQNQVPLATHLAESQEELQLLHERSGPLVDVLEALGVWRPEQIEAKSVRDVLASVIPATPLLLIHGNYLEREDWRWLRSQNPGTTIVYCPQTHAHFQHERHPWVEMMADGLLVALGTDSRASSPSLSLWDDLLIVRQRYPDQDPELLWRMATMHGARALGLEHELGSIRPGKLAKFCIANLGESTSNFSWEALLSPSTEIWGFSVPDHDDHC